MRSSSVRDRALKLSFYALCKHTADTEGGVVEDNATVNAIQMKRVLKLMRPHYNSLKVRSLLLCSMFLKMHSLFSYYLPFGVSD